MPAMPEFLEILETMKTTHIKKNDDYAGNNNPHENFIRQEEIMSWFKHDRDKVYAGMIALKLARLATLLNKEGPPNNESIEDTLCVDLPNYAVLWGARYKSDLKDAIVVHP
jgi:hypothetical protein